MLDRENSTGNGPDPALKHTGKLFLGDDAGQGNGQGNGVGDGTGKDAAEAAVRMLEAFIPDSPDGYDIPDTWSHDDVPEEVTRQVAALLASDKNDFKRFCHSAAMTDEQAGKAFAALGLIMAEHLAKCSMTDAENVDETLKKLAPSNPGQYWQTAKRGARHLNIGAELDEAGLTANPLVLRLVHAVGTLIGEDAMRGTAKIPRSLPFGEEARGEMLKAMQTEGYRKNDPSVMRLVESLAARVKR